MVKDRKRFEKNQQALFGLDPHVQNGKEYCTRRQLIIVHIGMVISDAKTRTPKLSPGQKYAYLHTHTRIGQVWMSLCSLSLSLSTIFSIYPHSTDFLSCFGHQKYSLRFHFTDGYINYIFFWRDAKDCMAFVEFENLNQKNSNTFFYNIINRCVNKWNRMNVCSAAAPALAAGAIVNCVHTIQKHIHLCSIQLQNAFAVPCNMILHFKMHLANQQVWVCVCVRMYVCMFVEWFRIYQLNGKVCVCMCYL